MAKERTLDEALDEFERWGDRVVGEVEGLSKAEALKYFKRTRSRVEKLTGKKLALPQRPAPTTTNAE